MRSNLLLVLASSLALLACRPKNPSTPPEQEVTPAADPAPTEAAAPSADARAMCEHSLGLMRADLEGTMEFTPEEIEKQQNECAIDIDAKRASMSEEEFQAKFSCIIAASTVEGIAACG